MITIWRNIAAHGDPKTIRASTTFWNMMICLFSWKSEETLIPTARESSGQRESSKESITAWFIKLETALISKISSEQKKMLKELRQQFENCDFYLDNSPLSIYKLWIPGDQNEPQVENLYIRESNGNHKLLTQDSAIIKYIPRSVRTVRIFADGQPTAISAICTKVRELEKTL